MELSNLKINVLGDSITESCGATSYDKGYVGVFASRHPDCTVRNYGIGGTRIAKQSTPSENPRFDLDFCTRAMEMDEDADLIVIFGGTNDHGHGDAPFGDPSDRTQDTFVGALHVLYRSVIERYPLSKIVVMTPLHKLDEDNPLGDGSRTLPTFPLSQYVKAIREVSEYYSIPVLDLYATSGLRPEIPVIQELYMPDGLHPNDRGHEILATKLEAFLRNL